MLEVKFYDEVEDSLLKFAVIISKSNGKWVFCKHKERDTFEAPGGHREAGESIFETANRELREETGAIDYTIKPVCVYSVTGKTRVNDTGEELFGMLFCADIKSFLSELDSEMEFITLMDELPSEWTYPLIQPKLLEEIIRRNAFSDNKFLLFGTGNSAKLDVMQRRLSPLGIKLISLQDVNCQLADVPENGNTPIENARQKALAYYREFHMPVFSCDSGLYIDNIPDEEQPGVHVRNVNGRCLSDEEMLEHYIGMAVRYGDLTARYQNAICLVLDEEHIYEAMDENMASEAFIITSKPHDSIRKKGFPLDCISLDIRTGKYYYDMEEDELAGIQVEDGFVKFFKKMLGKAYEYRRATVNDIDELVRTRIIVLRAANRLAEDVSMPEVEKESREYYMRTLESGEHIAYLVYDGERFIGAGGVSFYQVMPTYHNPSGRKAYIMNMYTDPEYRRQGIAMNTLHRLVKAAREQGVEAVSLEATAAGRPLYQKYGFVAMQDEMELK